MQSEHLILTQSPIPAADDPDIACLLELVASLSGSTWVQLDLRQQGSDHAVRFAFGSSPQEGGTTVVLQPRGRLRATLRYESSPPSPSLNTIVSFALEKTLHIRLLQQQAVLLRGALDTTSSAVLLFNPLGDILYANPPADRLLSRQTEDSLVVERRGEQPQPLFTLLCSLVEKIARRPCPEGCWHGTLAVSDGTVLGCEIIRIHNQDTDQQANVLAILQTTNAQPDRHLNAFAVSYKLTRREEEVVRLLLEGLNTGDVAGRLGISRHTVRDHLKNLYRKTATGSRNELLNLISRATSAPPLDDRLES